MARQLVPYALDQEENVIEMECQVLVRALY
jgi:hypothetical protein